MVENIFVNYRRGDDAGTVGRLFDRLEQAFGRDAVFMDIEGHIKPGDDYVEVLRSQIARCDILLAVVGPRWLTITDIDGRRRLDNPEDWVRVEIVTALEAGATKRVIPVLVAGAQMPNAGDLPDDLKPFARKQAVRLTLERFNQDAKSLVSEIERMRANMAIARMTERKADQAASTTGQSDGGVKLFARREILGKRSHATFGFLLGAAALLASITYVLINAYGTFQAGQKTQGSTETAEHRTTSGLVAKNSAGDATGEANVETDRPISGGRQKSLPSPASGEGVVGTSLRIEPQGAAPSQRPPPLHAPLSIRVDGGNQAGAAAHVRYALRSVKGISNDGQSQPRAALRLTASFGRDESDCGWRQTADIGYEFVDLATGGIIATGRSHGAICIAGQPREIDLDMETVRAAAQDLARRLEDQLKPILK